MIGDEYTLKVSLGKVMVLERATHNLRSTYAAELTYTVPDFKRDGTEKQRRKKVSSGAAFTDDNSPVEALRKLLAYLEEGGYDACMHYVEHGDPGMTTPRE